MKEYSLGNFVKIFGYLFSAGLVAGAVFAAHTGIVSENSNLSVLFHLIAIACFALAVFLIREIRISRFVITTDRLYIISMIYKRTLYFTQIKGWRDVDEEIHIIPNDAALKKIRVTHYFKEIGEIRYFLEEQFRNLETEELEEEHEEILTNEALGETIEDREQRLHQARQSARYTEWAGWAITGWLFLYPHPYLLSILAGLIYPFVAIAICFRYRGFLRAEDRKQSAYPTVSNTFAVVSITVGLRGVLDVEILNYAHGWFLIGAVAILMYVLFAIPTGVFKPRKKSEYVMIFLIPLFTFFYGFGSITLVNKLADTSEPARYETVITSKRVTSGKKKTYYVTLQKWSGVEEDQEVTVTAAEYLSTQEGDARTVYQYKGFLGMPWMEMASRPEH